MKVVKIVKVMKVVKIGAQIEGEGDEGNGTGGEGKKKLRTSRMGKCRLLLVMETDGTFLLLFGTHFSPSN